MSVRKCKVGRRANVMLVIFLLAFAASLFSAKYFGDAALKKDGIRCEKGVFDFSTAQPLPMHGKYYLTGDWEFFYGRYIHTDAEAAVEDSDFLPVPSSYAGNPLKSSPYPAGGHASYRAYIENLRTDTPLTVYVPNLACAYRIFLDGVLVTESGVLSPEAAESWSTPDSVRRQFYLTPQRHELVIELSAENYSGLYLTPVLMHYTASIQHEQLTVAVRYALAGTILYAAVILFCIVLFSKTRYFSPWLPVLFFCLALRIMISTEGYIVTQPLFGALSYEHMALLIFASTFVIKLVAIIYFRDELHLFFPLESIALLSSVFLLAALGVAFVPKGIYNNYYFVILQLVSIVADLYLVNQLCQSFAKGEKNSVLLTLAYFFLLTGITIDAVYTNGLLPLNYSSLLSLFLAGFALLLTIVHVRRAEENYKKAQEVKALERAVEKANTAVMISQIQPHFLYNALNTIKSLIRRDPKTAEKAVIDFSYYLRGNMDSLTQTEPIPFQTELQHIKYYCNIELLRFSDKLRVVYSIEEEDFTVPTLSIQPLVENAIKHGVTKRPEGGTVQLSTYADKDFYCICVEDDGIGFAPQALHKKDGRSHVGLENIRTRLETMLGAQLQISSVPNVGTKVLVKIPKSPPTEKTE